MVKEKIIRAFAQLGKYIQNTCKFQHIIEKANIDNAWFSDSFVRKSLENLSFMLNEEELRKWLNSYSLKENHKPKNIGLLLPGNIPAVGFHDILCTLASNNIAYIKLSSSDNVIIPFLLDILLEIEKEFKGKFFYVEKFSSINGLIATGRDETVKYFNEYFSSIPRIIRKHMTSIAILSGKESSTDLSNLADDIFVYYGLGCRNISKIYVPKEYFTNTKDLFLDAMEKYKGICMNNNKYMNNYTYNKALYLMNKIPFIDNGFLTITETKSLTSRLANINYEEYTDINCLATYLYNERNNLQCIATGINLAEYISNKCVSFGTSQKPKINQYADSIDTLEFLLNIN